jgi:hypothetical protein
MQTHTKIQIAVAILSFGSLVAFASTASTEGDEMQSFIGTTPNATAVAEQPATF